MGKVLKLGEWVLHAYSENNQNSRISISTSFLAHYRLVVNIKRINHRKRKMLFLHQFQTKKNEWISLDKQAILQEKQEIYPRKTALHLVELRRDSLLWIASQKCKNYSKSIVSNCVDFKQQFWCFCNTIMNYHILLLLVKLPFKSLDGKFYCIRCTHQTLRHLIFTCFVCF